MDTKTKIKISASLKNYHHHKKVISDCKAVAGFIILMATVSILIKLGTPTILADDTARYAFLPKNEDKQEITVRDKIIKAAQENNVEIKTALRIANCESGFRADAKNPVSTASGLWQFTEGTFLDGIRWRGLDWNLDDRFNVDKSTDMAMWFVKREGWGRWACK